MTTSHWPEWLDDVWAKSPEKGAGGQPESLAQHTWYVLERLTGLILLRPGLPQTLGVPRLWHILFWAAFLHDFGKAAGGFQARLRSGSKKWPHRHEVLSLVFLDWVAGGLTANEPVLLISRDDGRTWTAPFVIPLPGGMLATPAQSIIELADGRWLAVFDRWPAFDDPGPYRPQMICLSSSDQGQTWKDMVVMADGAGDGKGFWHGRPIRLQDDRLFSLYWSADMTHPESGPVDLPIHCAYADATGTTWDTPQPTSIPGQTNCVAQLPNGRLAAIYTWRECDKPGFMVVLSDDGRKWDLENQVRVWDATGWTQIGLNSPHRYPRSHDTIAFGAPSLITLTSGELFASWWCTYASLTHMRWAKLTTGV